mmetsp:Transcript_15312/g.26266  ORF Transcript_15312/g.26266 Transcript_15312/m.26266 type:complete len:401 (-) Transcript_15312:1269-2471(-)|eukprot:CAMPEP_0196659786 /NCGR_PEP_ID=MMETSP1086-20130531/36609_1 /TAXON_ID=77921 /ORGANISM="Cyanoptyche  gloeocystis , Strain SAG4.97" /LENGTH=400 /DNA_ID=CAMNT_0041993899 /DNA_START=324 /DNA_END=1526 /DNA_ORIENTATION=+
MGVVKKLTLDLLRTYKQLHPIHGPNPKKLVNRNVEQIPTCNKKGSHEDSCEYRALAEVGHIVHKRYVLHDLLGHGSFGEVYKAYDMESRRFVAMKIIKDEIGRTREAQNELDFLQRLNRMDPIGACHVVRLKEHFVYEAQDCSKHMCLVFEILEMGNLYHILVGRKFRGLSLELIRTFGCQILKALQLLSESNMVHCDLKPENILVGQGRDLKDCIVKVADFGSACRVGDNRCTYVQSRYYRSPEVLLGLPYGCAVDMWSLGTILVELYTGRPVFNGANELDQLHKICSTLGLPPRHLLHKCRYYDRFFFSPHTNDRPSPRLPRLRRLPKSSSPAPGARPLHLILGLEPGWESCRDAAADMLTSFHDLLSRMLAFDPDQRITPQQALQHPFFHAPPQVIA